MEPVRIKMPRRLRKMAESTATNICFKYLFVVSDGFPPLHAGWERVCSVVMTSVMMMMVESETRCFTNVGRRAKTTRDEYWSLFDR